MYDDILFQNRFLILGAGKTVCSPDWSWNSDNNNWRGFHLWNVFSGGANIKVSGEEYSLTIGDCFIFRMDETHICTHNPNDPLGVHTVYFHIFDKDNNFSVPSTKVIPRHKKMRNSPLVAELLERCIDRYIYGKTDEALLWFKPALSEFINEDGSQNRKGSSLQKLEMLCRIISLNPEKSYRLSDLSGISGYSENHLIRLFKKYKNISPCEYSIFAKIERAKSLLLYSNHSISEIAEILNYSDVSHFSKQFKKVAGINAKDYKRVSSPISFD